MSRMNIPWELDNAEWPLASTSEVVIVREGSNKLFVYGNTVPTDAASGYGIGCIFIHTNGGDGTALYVNEGPTTSCDFNAPAVNFTISKELHGATAATAANYGKIFVAPAICTVTKISEVHTTAGNDGSAVTLDVERLQGTETSGNGDALLGGTKIDLKGTDETVQSPALTGTAASLVLAAGDRLNLVDTGTLTTLAGVVVTVELEWTS